MFPDALAQHLGSLEEAIPWVEPDKGDVVIVEGQEAEEEDPAAADPLSQLDALGVESLDPGRERHEPELRRGARSRHLCGSPIGIH
ncbi:MAG TPA: hypothetical protein VGN84_10100 [Solirubrobacterales bacterium]|nr:hypothetical protein [Solirubrobacterales bacterium]